MPKTLAWIAVLLVAAAAGLWSLLDRGEPAPEVTPVQPAPAPTAPTAAGPAAFDLAAADTPGARSAREAAADPGRSAVPRQPDPGERSAGEAGELYGVVLDARGAGVADARVFVAAGGGGASPIDLVDPKSPFAGRRVEARTDADGRFRVRFSGGPELRLAIRRPGYAPLRRTRTRPKDGDLGEFRLEDSVVLEGRVLDDAGRPVAGAALQELPRNLGLSYVFLGGKDMALAVSDENGRFRVDELAAGPWRLLVRHPDHPDHVEEGETRRPGEIVSDLVIHLERGDAIEGRVDGIEEVEPGSLAVRARSSRALRGATPGLGFQLPRTGAVRADGTFRVGGLREGESVNLTVFDVTRGPFGSDRSPPVPARAGDRGVVLRLRPGVSITGRVVDARTGAPIENYLVEVGSGWMRAQTRDGREVREHPDGRFEYRAFDLGDGEAVSLRISADGYRLLQRSGLRSTPGTPLDVGTLSLEPAPLFPVRVLAAASGEPIEGATVRLAETGTAAEAAQLGWSGSADGGEVFFPSDDGETRVARTDESGLARVTALSGRTARLSVRAQGFVPYHSDPFTVPAVTPDAPRVVELQRGGTVVARVVDRDGAPVAGIRVEHRAPEGSEGSRSAPWAVGGAGDRTGADGVVRFERLAPGLHRFRLGRRGGGDSPFGPILVDVLGTKPGGGSAEGWTEVAVVEGGRHELTLVAPPAAQVRGIVTEAGQPLAGARIELRTSTQEEPQQPRFLLGGPVASGQADGRGAFELPDVDVGAYRVVVLHGSRAMPWEADIVLVEGENELVLDLPITAIEGRVVDDGGRPLAGARVTVARETPSSVESIQLVAFDGGATMISTTGGGAEPASTDEQGRFRLRGVVPGVPLTLTASREGGYQESRSEPLEVAAGEVLRGIELVLARGGALAVRVLEPSGGETVGGCFVRARFVGESETPVESEHGFAEGGSEVILEGLRPGPWRLTCQAFEPSGGEPRQSEPVEVEVRAGERIPVTLRLPPR